ncbi:MAG: trehalose-phosphatase [Candidatus Omnitrophota bacterium]|jgi:trehalose-phosphatase
MKHLFSGFDKIKKLLENKFILLLLDYDGTLTPIAQTPKNALIPGATKELLRRLSGIRYCRLCIISGRSLKGIKKAVGIKGAIYSGNHGLEIEGPRIKFRAPVPSASKPVIRKIYKDLAGRLSGIKGVLIEDKGLTISVHYRLVAKKDQREFLSIFFKITAPYAARDKIRVDPGKKVYEIKPPVRWDKGKASLWLLARERWILRGKKVLPVYIGDDSTDEDAFRALKGKGLTIFVGKSLRSGADYYLKDTWEVIKFLRLIPGLTRGQLWPNL